MANSADPDQLASSGSTLIAKAGHIRFSAGLGLIIKMNYSSF